MSRGDGGLLQQTMPSMCMVQDRELLLLCCYVL